MSAHGGILSRPLALALLLLGPSGCVQRAVLENEVRSAEARAQTLATVSNLHQAEAALSAQLVELEALYRRAPEEPRVLELLSRGYGLLARGFIEARRLEAVASADAAGVERERRDQADAEARARFYRDRVGTPQPATPAPLSTALTEAELACRKHEQGDYERSLSQLLSRPLRSAEERLELALSQRLAALWLEPRVAERCGFPAPPAAATSAAPAAPSPASR